MNPIRGATMGLFWAALVLFIGATLMLNRQQTNDAKAAKIIAANAEMRVSRFDERVGSLEKSEYKVNEILAQHQAIYEKLQQKYELLDVKTNAMRTHAPHIAPIQVQPIELRVVYRKAKQRPYVPSRPDPTAEKVIQGVKDKLKRVRQ